MHERAGVFLPKSHLLAKRSSITMGELRDEAFVVLDKKEFPRVYKYFMTMCKNAGFKPNVVASYPNAEVLLLIVQAGTGIAVLSPIVPVQGAKDVVCVPIKEGYDVTLDIIWRKDSMNAAMPIFVEAIQNLYAKH